MAASTKPTAAAARAAKSNLLPIDFKRLALTSKPPNCRNRVLQPWQRRIRHPASAIAYSIGKRRRDRRRRGEPHCKQ
jgi:hypothetical protein